MHNKENEFNSKYEKYADMLYRIAFLYLNNKSEAEDVLQDIFIKLLYKSPSFNGDEHEKAWLIRVTQNKCKDILRSAKHKKSELPDNLSSDDENEERLLSVRLSIMRLPEKYKTVVFLYYYEGYSIGEIAKILHISNSAVKMRLKRSREILKLDLEEQYEKE